MSSTESDLHCHYCSLILLIVVIVFFCQIKDCDDNVPMISEGIETSSQRKEKKTIVILSGIGLICWLICPLTSSSSNKFLKYGCLFCCYFIAVIVSILSLHYINTAKIGVCNTDNNPARFLTINNFSLLIVMVAYIYLFMTIHKISLYFMGGKKSRSVV